MNKELKQFEEGECKICKTFQKLAPKRFTNPDGNPLEDWWIYGVCNECLPKTFEEAINFKFPNE